MGEASRNSMVSIEVDVTCVVKKPFWYPSNPPVMQEAKTCLSPIRPAAVYVRSGAWYSKHSAFIAIKVQVLVGKSKSTFSCQGVWHVAVIHPQMCLKRIISLITSSSSCVFVLERDNRTIRDQSWLHPLPCFRSRRRNRPWLLGRSCGCVTWCAGEEGSVPFGRRYWHSKRRNWTIDVCDLGWRCRACWDVISPSSPTQSPPWRVEDFFVPICWTHLSTSCSWQTCLLEFETDPCCYLYPPSNSMTCQPTIWLRRCMWNKSSASVA